MFFPRQLYLCLSFVVFSGPVGSPLTHDMSTRELWTREVWRCPFSPTSRGQERCQGLSRPTTKPFRRGWFLGVSRCRGHLGMNNNTYWHLKVPCVNLVNSKTLVWYGLIPQASTSYKPCIVLSTSQVRYPSRHTAWSAAKHLVSTILSKSVEYESMALVHTSYIWLCPKKLYTPKLDKTGMFIDDDTP
jgi:hypothetical protein